MATTKLRSSKMSLHGVFYKSRVFDPTCLYEANAKPIILFTVNRYRSIPIGSTTL